MTIAAALMPAAALGATYADVAVAAAILFDAPSDKAVKRFIVSESTPLEVLSQLPPWTKVRDVDGSVLWIRSDALGEQRHVIASATAAVRESPADAAAVRFRAARGVLLERIGTDDGWVEVRHGGTIGYVRADEVWGD